MAIITLNGEKDKADYDDILNTLIHDDAGKEDDLNVCTHASTSEHSRISENDEPCDDGRAG